MPAFSSADPNAFAAIGMQSAKGTPQTTVTKLRYVKYLSGTDVQPQPEVVDLREGGDGLDWGYSYKKSQKVAGQLVVNARPEILGQLLQLMPGGATWDGGSAPAVHTFQAGHASFPWSTIFVQHPGSTLPQLVSDARITGFTIEGAAGEPVKLTLPFVGIQHAATFAAVVPTYFAEEPFLYHMTPTYVLDGSGDTSITAYKIEGGLGIEEIQTQAISLEEIAVMNRDANVELTRLYQDATLWKKINMGAGLAPTTSVATGSLRVGYNNGAAGAAIRDLQMHVPLLSYRGDSLTELDPDGKTVYETVSAKALKGASQTFWAVVKNSHASAYLS